jgi:hypothetical protein
MAAPIPSTEPTKFVRGDSIAWTRGDLSSDYPASTWALTYEFVPLGSAGTAFTITADADGDDYSVTVAAATTAAYVAATYEWAAFVTLSADRYRIDNGTLELLENLADPAAGYDGRSHVRIVVEAIDAVIQGRATKDQESYTIDGRSLQRTPIPDLLTLRSRYRAELKSEEAAEKIANGLGSGRLVKVRF